MTYDSSDLLNATPTIRTRLQTANGHFVAVTKTENVEISPSINLRNCLLIFRLTHKLLSVSSLTKELNCTVTKSSTDCVVQDAKATKIIGCGIERGGWYYVDEANHKGHTLLAHSFPDHQMLMWHRRLDHLLLGYLKRLFPSLNNCNIPLKL